MSNVYLEGFSGKDAWACAHAYRDGGFSVIPCRLDKRPAIASWKQYQESRPSINQVEQWFGRGTWRLNSNKKDGHQSIGVLCGDISRGLVVIDLDGWLAVRQFYRAWGEWISGKTLVVKTGSGYGVHIYFIVADMPDNINVRVPDVGGFEIRGNGCYVIAPPSPHPSGGTYTPIALRPIMRVANLDPVRKWIESLRPSKDLPTDTIPSQAIASVATQSPMKRNYLDSVVSRELARVAMSHQGNRNNNLYYAGLRLANYAAGGELIWSQCKEQLIAAGVGVGLPLIDCMRTVESAWNTGSKYPKRVPEGYSNGRA